MEKFDEIIDRKGTYSLKYDGIKERFGFSGEGILPMWVADMDFLTPMAIRDALTNYIKGGALGYSGGYDDVLESIISWYKRRHDLELHKEWLEFSGIIVSTIARIINEFTQEGDKVLIQSPVYSNFYDLIKNNNRYVVENPLILRDGKYVMDLEHLKSVIDPKVKMMIICNPHNPVGRAWTKEELEELTRILTDNKILIVSDDAHCELLHSNYKHNFVLQCGEGVMNNSITCVSQHKTFNMAGLEISNVIIPNKDIMARYKNSLYREGINKPNLLGLVALKAGLDNGDEWLSQVMQYIEGNFEFLKKYLNENLQDARVIDPEATFLAWIDLRDLGFEYTEIKNRLENKGKLLVNQGYTFGSGGEGFIRMNLACPRKTLKDGLDRLVMALK